MFTKRSSLLISKEQCVLEIAGQIMPMKQLRRLQPLMSRNLEKCLTMKELRVTGKK